MEKLLKEAIADSMTLGLRHRARDLAIQLAVLEAIKRNEEPNVNEALLRLELTGTISHTLEDEEDVIRILGATNPFDTLGLEKSPTQAETKKAYMRASMSVNPRINKVSSANSALIKVDEAFKSISNPKKMREYKKFLNYVHQSGLVASALREDKNRAMVLCEAIRRRITDAADSKKSGVGSTRHRRVQANVDTASRGQQTDTSMNDLACSEAQTDLTGPEATESQQTQTDFHQCKEQHTQTLPKTPPQVMVQCSRSNDLESHVGRADSAAGDGQGAEGELPDNDNDQIRTTTAAQDSFSIVLSISSTRVNGICRNYGSHGDGQGASPSNRNNTTNLSVLSNGLNPSSLIATGNPVTLVDTASVSRRTNTASRGRRHTKSRALRSSTDEARTSPGYDPNSTSTAKKSFHCERCSVSCTTRYNLQRHIARRHQGGRKRDMIADPCEMNRMQRYHHRTRTSKPWTLECSFCGKRLSTTPNLYRHVRSSHINAKNP